MMKRKEYEKPTMQVVLLRQQGHLLTVSENVPGTQGMRPGFGTAIEDTWGEE